MSAMKLLTQSVTTNRRDELIDVTARVQSAIDQHRVKEGYVIVYVPHTTAAVTINENADPDVQHDLLAKLRAMIPREELYYQHGEGNSDAHLKTSLVGSSVTVLIEDGKLVLGRWQGIYFAEFDGPRRRQMHIKVVSLDP